jgi:PAS domain-containing protein
MDMGAADATLPRSASLWNAKKMSGSQAVKVRFNEGTKVFRVKRSSKLSSLEQRARKSFHVNGVTLQYKGRVLDEHLYLKLLDEYTGKTLPLTAYAHGAHSDPRSSEESTSLLPAPRRGSRAALKPSPMAAVAMFAPLDRFAVPLMSGDSRGKLAFANEMALQMLGWSSTSGVSISTILPDVEWLNREPRTILAPVQIGPELPPQTTEWAEGERVMAIVSLSFVEDRTQISAMPLSLALRRAILSSAFTDSTPPDVADADAATSASTRAPVAA